MLGCMKRRVFLIGGLTIITVIVIGWIFFREKSSVSRLKVMVYPSFLSPYGPAHEIKKKFEKICSCAIHWISVEDSTLMTQRLQLNSDGFGVDVVFGLDQLTLSSSDLKWRSFFVSVENLIPQAKQWLGVFGVKSLSSQYQAVPVNWSPLTFLSRSSLDSLIGIQDLLDSQWNKKISLPHPRLSSLGLQFYFWIFSIFDSKEKRLQFLHQFKNQIYSLTHSWSSSYGLFQKELADLTFSYQTSLMYHFVEERKNYHSTQLSQGHPYQVEFAVIPNTCVECNLAEKFIQFLLEEEVQRILMHKNYMLPVNKYAVQNTPFENLKKLPLISYEKIDDFLSQKKQLLKEWNDVF